MFYKYKIKVIYSVLKVYIIANFFFIQLFYEFLTKLLKLLTMIEVVSIFSFSSVNYWFQNFKALLFCICFLLIFFLSFLLWVYLELHFNFYVGTIIFVLEIKLTSSAFHNLLTGNKVILHIKYRHLVNLQSHIDTHPVC